jgi:hypothetical protein
MVRVEGNAPSTSVESGQRSTSELYAHELNNYLLYADVPTVIHLDDRGCTH